MNQKYCTKCNQLKDYSAFDMNGPRLRSQCRTCRSTANTERVQRKALEHAMKNVPPDWSVLSDGYPRTAAGLLVPVDRLTDEQRAQVCKLNELRRAAGVWEINLGD